MRNSQTGMRIAIAFLIVVVVSATPACLTSVLGADTARKKAVEQKLAAIWQEVNQRWRDHGQTRVTQVEVADVSLQSLAPPAGFTVPPGSRNVIAKDGIYYRDGRPTFLFGVEGRMYDGPWINRILGLDFFSQHAGMVWWRSAMRVKESPGPRGGTKLTVSFRNYPWAGMLVREAMRGGTLFAIDYYLTKSGDSNLRFKQYDFDPLFFGGPRDYERGTGHFLNLHLENPEAFNYYTSQFDVVAKLIGEYPIFHHELINEIRYNSYWPENIIAFQDRMKQKYGTIAAANKAWNTTFADFDDVIPPITADPGSFFWQPEVEGRGWRLGNILADWSKFMAEHGAGLFEKLRDDAEKATGGTNGKNTLFTIQSPNCLGGGQLLPHLKAKSEDVYGHEAFFYPYRSGSAGQEEWAQVLALVSLQFRNDLVRCAAPDKTLIKLEAPRGITPAHYEAGAVGVQEPGDPAGPNFMRMFFWHQLAHGLSGSVVSYFYVNECSHGGYSMWDPKVMTRDAVREMPSVRAEIRDLAPVVMPRTRIRGKLGVVYSHETAMESEYARRDFFKENISNYAAAILTRVPVDIVTTPQILDGTAAEYPVLFVNHCIRFPRAALNKLTQYVKSGGTLLMTHDSLSYDERVEPYDLDDLLGARRTDSARQDDKADLSDISLSEVSPVRTRVSSPSFGYHLELTTAEGLGDSPRGPAICVNKMGKGRVIYVGWNLPADAMRGVVAHACRLAGVSPTVDVEFDDRVATDYVETHLFGKSGSGRHVVYSLNFGGGPRKARLIPATLARGNEKYYVRNVRTRQYVAPGGRKAKAAWVAADLANGIPTSLPAQDPELLLVERTNLAPLELNGLTEEQTEVLKWAWRPSRPAKHRLLVNGYHVGEFRVSKPKMPSAVKALEDAGWEVNSMISRLENTVETLSSKGITQEKLDSYQVLAFIGLHHGTSVWRSEEIRRLIKYVHDGGSLLACIKRDWHFEAPFYEDLKPLGIGDAGLAIGEGTGEATDAGGNIFDPTNCIMGEPLYVGLKDPSEHPITEGISLFQTTGIRPLYVGNPAATTLFASGPKAEVMNLWGERRPAPDVPVAVALVHGKGRVVVVGSDTWLRPDELELGDNKRLLINILDWLGRR
ncbi:MAG: beta-galactosidase trimerization domain-containing protein [Planctomycetes bacterium]|nr:beta-galactosidase trimerization domain-containing protein [Planctomycetota bacterium]